MSFAFDLKAGLSSDSDEEEQENNLQPSNPGLNSTSNKPATETQNNNQYLKTTNNSYDSEKLSPPTFNQSGISRKASDASSRSFSSPLTAAPAINSKRQGIINMKTPSFPPEVEDSSKHRSISAHDDHDWDDLDSWTSNNNSTFSDINWTRQEEIGVLDMYQVEEIVPLEWTDYFGERLDKLALLDLANNDLANSASKLSGIGGSITSMVPSEQGSHKSDLSKQSLNLNAGGKSFALGNANRYPSTNSLAGITSNPTPSNPAFDNQAHQESLYHIAEGLQSNEDPLGIVKGTRMGMIITAFSNSQQQNSSTNINGAGINKSSVAASNNSLKGTNNNAAAPATATKIKRQTMNIQKALSELHSDNRVIFLTSKHFDPKAFLLEVHGTTSFQDLLKGSEALRASIIERKNLSKKLVKQNFDSFVNAKSLIDVVYQDMKVNIFNRPGYGIQKALDSLEGCLGISDRTYNPILDCSDRAEVIRSQLAIIDRYRFYFNLPNSLNESLRKQSFNVLVRDYKRGKTILSEHREKLFKQIWKDVEKVINEAKAIIQRRLMDASLPLDIQERNIMFLIDLDSANDPITLYLKTQQEHIIKMMNSTLSEHNQLQGEILRTWKKQESASSEAKIRDGQMLTPLFKKMLVDVCTTNEVEKSQVHLKQLDHKLWILKIDTVKTLCHQVMLKKMPDFNSVAKLALSSLNSTANVSKEEVINQVDSMFKKIGENFCNQIKALLPLFGSNLFDANKKGVEKSQLLSKVNGLFTAQATASDISPSDLPEVMLCLLLKQPLNAPYYSLELLALLVDFFNELKVFKMANPILNQLATLIIDLKVYLVSLINSSALYESKFFRVHEQWEPDPEVPEITMATRLFYRFVKYISRSNYIIFTTRVVIPTNANSRVRNDSSDHHQFNSSSGDNSIIVSLIQTSFKLCLMAFLEGLNSLAINIKENIRDQIEWGILSGDYVSGKCYTPLFYTTKSGSKVPVLTNDSSRYLVILSNCKYLKENAFPGLFKLFQEMMISSGKGQGVDNNALYQFQKGVLVDVGVRLCQLEVTLLSRFLDPIQINLSERIKSGLLAPHLKLEAMTTVTDVRGKVFSLLLESVVWHAQVQDICPILLTSIMILLCDRLFLAYLECLGKSTSTSPSSSTSEWRLGSLAIGGYQQLVLELDFIQTILADYLEPPIEIGSKNPFLSEAEFEGVSSDSTSLSSMIKADPKETIRRIKAALDHLLSLDKSGAGTGKKADATRLATLLDNAKRATENQFLCFKKVN